MDGWYTLHKRCDEVILSVLRSEVTTYSASPDLRHKIDWRFRLQKMGALQTGRRFAFLLQPVQSELLYPTKGSDFPLFRL